MAEALKKLQTPDERERKMHLVLPDFASRFGITLTERELELAFKAARDRAFTNKETEAIGRAVCYASMIRNGDPDGALKRFNFMAVDPEIKEKHGPNFDKAVLAEMKRLDQGAAEELSKRLTKGKEKVAIRD